MALICVSLAEKDVKSAVRAARNLKCDLVEVRLDHMKDLSAIEGLSRIRQPIIVTCMPVYEGGRYKGPEPKRAALLESTLDFASYVSVELRMNPDERDRLVMKARKRKVKVIMGYHDFAWTRSTDEIMEILEAERDCGADIAKVAFKPLNPEDVLNVMLAQAKAKLEIPVIAISMGELGRVSRIVGPMLGGYLTFASRDKVKKAAAGQYTLDEMKRIRELAWR
jgi:3-dehydroquinate dehydratase type I